EAAVERLAGAAVALGHEDLDRQLAVVRARDLDGVVRRAVVDQDDPPAVTPQVGARLQVGKETRNVRLLVVGRDHEASHQYAPWRLRTVGSVWTRILMSPQSDQLVT